MKHALREFALKGYIWLLVRHKILLRIIIFQYLTYVINAYKVFEVLFNNAKAFDLNNM